MTNRFLKLMGVSMLALAASSCGYRATGSTATKLPSDVHTIAIPTFANHTSTYKIEQLLTAAVIRDFNARTNYHVVNQASADTDATLQGIVTAASMTPLTYDTSTGRASSAVVTVNMKVTLVSRDGKVLFQNQDYSFREQYQITREVSSFFEEQSPALDRMARDFGRTLVSNILEAY
jgi:lipopolysaccharide assembly LptE-like protein